MMRDLFLSERRCIQSISRRQWGISPEVFDPVIQEEYLPPRNAEGVRFNTDYSLQFVASEDLKDFQSHCVSILPNTLGADLFLTVDRHTRRPLHTELMDGEAFSIKHYAQYIERIEHRLRQLGQHIFLSKSAYSRIFVIEADICFLIFPNDSVPTLRGQRQLLCSGEESTIACSIEADRIVYIDGWMRTDTVESELTLVAVPDNP